jgi:hypothetical protein
MQRATGPLCLISEMVANQTMSKRRNVSGSLTQPALWKQNLWRWLYTELRGAILDGRFDAQRHLFFASPSPLNTKAVGNS